MTDIAAELSEYRNAIFVLVGVIVFLILVFIVVNFYMDSFKRRDIVDFLGEPVMPDSYFLKEADRCYRHFAKTMMLQQHGSDADLFCRKMRDRLKPLFFMQQTSGGSYPVLYIAPQFAEFILQQPGHHTAGEVFKFMKAYVKHMYHDVSGISHVDAEFESYLVNNVVDRVMMTDAAQKEVQRRIEESVPVPVICEQNHDADVYAEEKKELSRRLALSSFNCAVRDIKLHDGVGMVPQRDGYLSRQVYDMLCGLKIYTQQKIKGMVHLDEASVLDCEGCYVVLNTFNARYFVGRSDMMFTRVYELVTSYDSGACASLKQDVNEGHLVLVKFVPLEQTGYTDAVKLQRGLVLSYDCRHDRGYNR